MTWLVVTAWTLEALMPGTVRVESGRRNVPIIGVMMPSEFEPEKIADVARDIQAAGFSEMWLAEDCGHGGGFSSAGAALSATSSLRIGVGIFPALVRNPVFLAMEIATLCRLYPRRFLPGIGHGWRPWMEDIGAEVKSPLTALEEVIAATRLLLQGERVSLDTNYIKLRNVILRHPPTYAPPLSLGVSRVNSLKLSGRVADGTILPEGTSPEYLSHALESIHAGACSGGRSSGYHRVTVITWCEVTDDQIEGCERLRPVVTEFLNSGTLDPQLAALGIQGEQGYFPKRGPAVELSDEIIMRLAVVGDEKYCLGRLVHLARAGADAVIVKAATNSTHYQLVNKLAEVLPDWRQSL
jgi:alkanesulfonate monooxygenase SsuD/methylene tetrahydromethanopterin reductase-like flavin-dependent oxidoreductase (luciferase family)